MSTGKIDKVAPSYLVCATERSGSTLLCELLAGTGVAGRPEEFFEPSAYEEGEEEGASEEEERS